jgi:hypothetical protein
MNKWLLLFCIFLTGACLGQQPVYKNIVVKDPSKYGTWFLKELAKDTLQHYILDDSLFITGSDTTFFPADVPTGKYIILNGVINDDAYTLRLKRENYTTLLYELTILKKWKRSTTEKGDIALYPSFYLTTQTVEDFNGNAYTATAYHGRGKYCSTTIRIGKSAGMVLAKISRACADKKEDIRLDDSPLLWEK